MLVRLKNECNTVSVCPTLVQERFDVFMMEAIKLQVPSLKPRARAIPPCVSSPQAPPACPCSWEFACGN